MSYESPAARIVRAVTQDPSKAAVVWSPESGWLDEPATKYDSTTVCSKCKRPLYADRMPREDGGQVWRDEINESTLCPLGERHELDRRSK